MEDTSFLYEIQPYTYEKAKQIGVQVFPSFHPKYKIDIFDEYGNFITRVGGKGYADYPTFIKDRGLEYANKRRELFKNRHKKNIKKIGTRAWFADVLLW